MLSTIALFSSGRRKGNADQLMDGIARQRGIELVDLGSPRLTACDYEPLMQRLLLRDPQDAATREFVARVRQATRS